MEVPCSALNLAWQMRLETFSSRFEKVQFDFEGYGDLAINDLRLATEAIRLQADEFSYWRHWPSILASTQVKRSHAETVLSMIGALLGYRLRCRSKKGRKNEVRVKLALFDIIQLAMRKDFWS